MCGREICTTSAPASLSHSLPCPQRRSISADIYEILCTVAEARCPAFADDARRAGVTLTSVGTVIEGTLAPRFLDAQGSEIALAHLSYSHF